jgi:putative heme iron utilization protein
MQAIDQFIAKKAEIDEMLARLQTLSADHFNTHPDNIDWGHVGTISHYAELLKEITDQAFNEGEHA